MVRCPNCGYAAEEGHSFCMNCGTSLGGGQGEGPQSQQGTRPPAEQGRQPGAQRGTQSGQPRQPRNQQSAGGRGGQGPQSAQRPPGGGQGGGLLAGRDITRRQFLLYGGGGAAVLAGGALGANTLLGPDYSGPKGTARHFLNALNNGNSDTAESLIHSERVDQADDIVLGQYAGLIRRYADTGGELSDGQVNDGLSMMEGMADVNEITLESEDERSIDGETRQTATVVADIKTTLPGGAGKIDYSATVDLRTEDGEWKVWDMSYDGLLSGLSGVGGFGG